MNNDRRKELKRAIALIEDAKAIIEECTEQEQSYLDDMPDNLQESARACDAQDNIEGLEGAFTDCDSALEYITETIER